MRNTFITLLILLFLSSCEREKALNFSPPFEGEKLVVYGILRPNGESKIEVYRTQAIDEDFPSGAIDGVDAFLINSDNDSMKYEFSGHIGTCYMPVDQGKEYYVSVRYKQLEVVSTKITQPIRPSLDSVKYVFLSDSSNLVLDVYFTPNDSEGTYAYTIDKINSDTTISTKLFVPNSIKSYASFAGDFHVRRNEYFYELDSAIIKLHNLSTPAFDFYESLAYNNGDIGSAFSDKVPPKTNIIGGYGFFVLSATDSLVLRF